MQTATLQLHVSGMTCNGCVKTLTQLFSVEKGVAHSEIELATGRVSINYDPQITSKDKLAAVITNAGFDIESE